MSAARPESSFWSQLRHSAPKGAHLARIESSVGSGIPDVTACMDGREVWMELKVEKLGGRVHFRTAQRIWAIESARAGRRTTIVCKRLSDDVVVWPGKRLTDVVRRVDSPFEFSVRIADLGDPFIRIVKSYDWDHFWEKLFSTDW